MLWAPWPSSYEEGHAQVFHGCSPYVLADVTSGHRFAQSIAAFSKGAITLAKEESCDDKIQ